MAPIVEAVTEPIWMSEGPHWDHREQALYFLGVFEGTVHKYVPATRQHTRAKLDDNPCFIIPIEGRRNHSAVGLQRKVVEIEWSGEPDTAKVIRTIAEVDHENPKNKLNDSKADPRGRLFTGTMGHQYEPGKFELNKSSLYRVGPDGSAHQLADRVSMSNGLCWDLQKAAFYYIDSFAYDIKRYDYDVDTGNIFNMKVVFSCQEQGLEGLLDGMTVDTDGNLWVATFHGQQVVKINPESGTVMEKVPIPALQVTSVTFGGPTLDTLYVTTGNMHKDREEKPTSGAVFKVTGLGVTGYPAVNVRIK